MAQLQQTKSAQDDISLEEFSLSCRSSKNQVREKKIVTQKKEIVPSFRLGKKIFRPFGSFGGTKVRP